MNSLSIESFGWKSFFQQQLTESLRASGFQAGRIAVENKHQYLIYSADGELTGELSGRLQYAAESESDLPKVGDWVLMWVFPAERKAIIHQVLERMSRFSRKVAGRTTDEQIIATNIDLIFIVQSLDHNFNLPRLERYLVLAYESGAQPVIILSKADLCPDVPVKLTEVRRISLPVPVLAVSVLNEASLEPVKALTQPGLTVVFVGSSGVGKSTLINRLMGRELQQTSAVRESDSKGRHTTTRRELLMMENGALLLDTPGMRELQLWNATEGLAETFADIGALAQDCRFRDCTHTCESHCAVIRAMEQGSLSAERYHSYLKLQRELAFLEASQDQNVYLQRKHQYKKMQKAANQLFRRKE